MTIENKAGIYNDMSGFSAMRRLAREDPESALRQVAEQFEAIFMQMMLKSMRDASMGDSLFDSDQSQMYQEMFDNQLSLSLSKGKANGLADILVQQLSGTLSPKDSELQKVQEFNALNLNNVNQEQAVTQTKQQRFINTVLPYAEKAAEKLGTNSDILIAQAALETGWGQGVQRHPDGRSGFNLFNIKANRGWEGPIVSKTTLEYKNGIATREHANFRAYTSMDESFNDYVDFLKSNPRYEKALKSSSDSGAYIKELANSGYATDPAYADKILNLMSKEITPNINKTSDVAKELNIDKGER